MWYSNNIQNLQTFLEHALKDALPYVKYGELTVYFYTLCQNLTDLRKIPGFRLAALPEIVISCPIMVIVCKLYEKNFFKQSLIPTFIN